MSPDIDGLNGIGFQRAAIVQGRRNSKAREKCTMAVLQTRQLTLRP